VSIATAIAAIMSATAPGAVKPQNPPARFFLAVPNERDAALVRAEIAAALSPLHALVEPISASAARDLVVTIPERAFAGSPNAAFAAARALEDALGYAPIEPEVVHAVMPIDQLDDRKELEAIDKFPPGCWVDDEPNIEQDKPWAVERLRLPEAWKLSEAMGRPSRGAGINVCQIDTGVTDHPELAGVVRAGSFNILGDGKTVEDPTDPLDPIGNPGHGTGTASVAISPENLQVVGAAPKARHLPIRAIDSVVRLSQTNVAAAIDKAVELGAHVISMSLGGIWSFALQRALTRAVAADVIVVAAAGNCVKLVVWPARFEDCIAVAGTDFHDKPWIGTCYGPSVTVSAPGQNVYRASATTKKSGQGQGTSFAVALVAGVAACWLAHHGRSVIAAEARTRNETIQAMFKRLLRISARRPGADWDAFNMGAGVVDARALLEAAFDAGVGIEAPQPPVVAKRGDESLRQFALEAFGPAGAEADIDWMRVGGQTSLAVLQQRLAARAAAPSALEGAAPGTPGLTELPPEVVQKLEQVGSATLEAAVPRPAVRRRATEEAAGPASPRIVELKRMVAARHAAEQAAAAGTLESISPGGLESTRGGTDLGLAVQLESSMAPDAAVPHADDVLHRIDGIVRAMPPREIGDPAAFRRALETMFAHGHDALAKLPDVGVGAVPRFTSDEQMALEAIVIADGSRPSFLLEKGLPPQTHPFLGIWAGTIAGLRNQIQQVAFSVGRVQPSNGSASNFIGTATIVDAAKGLALTNYHVVDDARSRWLIPMVSKGNRLQVPSGLEVEFGGEAATLDQNRCKVVEVILPSGFGRGFGNLDAAVLTIEPLTSADYVPKTPVIFDQRAAFAGGGVTSLALIGFPGPPRTDDSKGGVDWGFVTSALFGGLFGFKRLAPGKFARGLGFDPKDSLRAVFGHDGTTFGGSSGTGVIAWTDKNMPAFGLHFAGVTSETNSAMAIAKVADALRAVGVPVV
jgi:subtilisin family serine protease